MKCKDCTSCYKGWFRSNPNEHICIAVKEPFVIDDINVECTEYPTKVKTYHRRGGSKKIYEDENWIIEIISETTFNPIIRISSFKDNHCVGDFEVSRMLMEDDSALDAIKEITYK